MRFIGWMLMALLCSLILVSDASAEEDFVLPSHLTVIEDEAFLNAQIHELFLPDGVTYVGSKAFAHTGLQTVYIPESVQFIAEDAFEGCEALIPVVHPGSYADQWCQEHSLTVMNVIGLGVDGHTQSEIRAFVNAHPAETYSMTGYRRNPSANPYVPGLISEESTQNAINMLNQVRYIAGLNANVANDPDMEEMMAATAMVNGLNGTISHYPDRPSALSDSRYDDLYDLAYRGAGSSNLYAGMDNLAAGILGFVYDSGSSNISRLGHRRWILHTRMGKTAFGFYSNNDSLYRYFSCMYAFDSSGSGTQTRVAWPARQTPLSHFINASTQAWSVSFGQKLEAGNIRVTLTRASDGRMWHFSQDQSDGDFYVENGNYGNPGCVIFRAAGIGTISAGDSFVVCIENRSDYTVLRYTVTFFDL